MEDQHFIVWMRTAGLPTFQKLFGVIHEDLNKGDYQLDVTNNYDVSSFDGKKYFVLATTNQLGGNNYFLAYCFLICGTINSILAISFFILYIRCGKRNKKEKIKIL